MRYIWILIVLVYYCIYAYFSKQLNDTKQIKYVMWLFGLQAFGLWPIIAYYSTNLMRDGLLYDLVILLGFYGGMFLLGAANNFTPIQWIGTFLALLGIWMMK